MTELLFIGILRRNKVTGWRRRFRLVGSPDFVFGQHKLAVFVDGCYWHGCSKHCRIPKGNRAYWQQKITGNQARDRKVNRTLRSSNWHLLRMWEHALRNPEQCLARIRKALARNRLGRVTERASANFRIAGSRSGG